MRLPGYLYFAVAHQLRLLAGSAWLATTSFAFNDPTQHIESKLFYRHVQKGQLRFNMGSATIIRCLRWGLDDLRAGGLQLIGAAGEL